jgi:pyridoxamine 5'-phosphate oxidase
MKDLSDKRLEYQKASLNKEDMAIDPMVQFERWYLDAEQSEIMEPNAMTLSTVSEDGKPSSRIVLLKGFNSKGFIFYTNYESRKGREIAVNPWVSLVFWFKELQRQVRIEGLAGKVDHDTALGYFHSRPRGSQISAWASPQSQVIDEQTFEANRQQIEERFKGLDHLPLPEFWGGYMVKPSIMEFWQGRENRYHDRFKYHLSDDGHWYIDRLAP